MLNIGFYYQGHLMQKEIIGALKRLPNVKLFVFTIPGIISKEEVEKACKELLKNNIRILFTVNDWGLDFEGETAKFLNQHSIVHINWYPDDPFYYEIFFNKKLIAYPNELNFITDRSYIELLKIRGIKSFYLPLASDPEIFYPLNPPCEYKRTTCFVGNSYYEQINSFTKDYEHYLDNLTPFLTNLYFEYQKNPFIDLEAIIATRINSETLPDNLTFNKAVFILKHIVSNIFRKKLILSIASEYPDFMVFGDNNWCLYLPSEKVSTSVKYYTNLSVTYQETKVNIDINRIVIRDGLTQRVFDCLNCGAFIISNYKHALAELFNVHGDKKEVVAFENEQHLKELIKYYLKHDLKRKDIAARGRERVLKEHTYDHRIAEIFRVLSKELGKI